MLELVAIGPEAAVLKYSEEHGIGISVRVVRRVERHIGG